MSEREKPARPVVLAEGALSSLPAVASAPLGSSDRRRTERPSPATSGRCGFCGSTDTFSISPQSFQEWALERWGDAALRRCHDCGRRQAVAGLVAGMRAEWRPAQGLIKMVGWAVLAWGAVTLLLFVLKSGERRGPSGPAPFNLPRERPTPNAPAPSPSSGPLSFRSTPTSVA